jgi:hypothetical protein
VHQLDLSPGLGSLSCRKVSGLLQDSRDVGMLVAKRCASARGEVEQHPTRIINEPRPFPACCENWLRRIWPDRPVVPIPLVQLVALHRRGIIGRSAAKSNARARTRGLPGDDYLPDCLSLGLCFPHEVDA